MNISKLSKIYETPNPNLKHVYTGSHYAISATGGFSLLESIHKLKINTIKGICKCDTTNAIQILFPADVINAQIFENQVIISSELFSKSITRDSILSIGNIDEIYSDYFNNVNETMGHHFNNSLLNSSCQFTTETIYNTLLNSLLNYQSIKGEIFLLDIEETLKNIKEINVFRNRPSFIDSTSNTFVVGDLIYIENGISIGLLLNMNYSHSIHELLKKKINIQCEKNDIENMNIFEKQYQTGLLLRVI
jgi:hypothetical protein